jgi:hypothetical protein
MDVPVTHRKRRNNSGKQWQLYIRQFKDHTRLEMLKFTHFLLSQGLSMLFNLQCMDISEQTEFALPAFYRVSKNHHPVVLMVNGIDLYRKGTVEERPWQPWKGIEYPSYRSLGVWKSGEAFWDKGRMYRLERDRPGFVVR